MESREGQETGAIAPVPENACKKKKNILFLKITS
jgi:hypothetical protein